MFVRVEALNPQRHAKLRFAPAKSYAFAGDVQTAPLAAGEIIEAAKHYPVVFAPDGEVVPTALLGLTPERNAFINADGEWTVPYVPAHFRRYPFILAPTEEADRFATAIDLDAECFGTEGEALFEDDGQPSEVTKRAIEFLRQFQQELGATTQVFGDLREAGILVNKRVEFTESEGQTRHLEGFAVVDMQKIAEAEDQAILEWRQRGVLPLLYACAWSVSNLQRLVAL